MKALEVEGMNCSKLIIVIMALEEVLTSIKLADRASVVMNSGNSKVRSVLRDVGAYRAMALIGK
jgi:hypothetical protein